MSDVNKPVVDIRSCIKMCIESFDNEESTERIMKCIEDDKELERIKASKISFEEVLGEPFSLNVIIKK